MNIKSYTKSLHQFLHAVGDESIAEKQSKYMRYRFPYIGLMKDTQVKYYKEFQSENGVVKSENAVEFAKELILYPERELWYIATQTLIKHKNKLEEKDFPFVKEYLIKSDWWDVVDIVSSNVVGTMAAKFPTIKEEVNSWIDDDNFWLRRVAIIYQLTYRLKTDENLLYAHILKTCHESEFFIRKAIGWSLREYSKHNKSSVQYFIDTNRDKLSTLSIREGSKYLL
jgi:3-methyladenine DNA glycosylase AlkD